MSKWDTSPNAASILRRALRSVPLQHHFKVHACSNLTVGRAWRIEPRVITDLHVVFVMGGRGTYYVDGTRIDLRRGRVVFVSNGVTYASEQDDTDPPHIIPVRFGAYDNRTRKQADMLREPAWLSVIPDDAEHLRGAFVMLANQHLRGGAFHAGLCSSLLHRILCELALQGEHGRYRRTQLEEQIDGVRRHIEDNPLERTSVDELARRAGLSRKYFTTMFRKHVGQSPKSYQVSARLNHGRQLLARPGVTVKGVAYELGYPDPYLFSKQFKELFGYPPVRARQA
jgi:AraC-like DNA-binding protein